jgi:hypothetical protein
MTLSEAPGTLKKFRRSPWKFQQTFLTPMQSLQGFVTAIVSANQQMKSACLTIEQVVFEPSHLINLLASHSLPQTYGCDVSLTAAKDRLQRFPREMGEAYLGGGLTSVMYAQSPSNNGFVDCCG